MLEWFNAAPDTEAERTDRSRKATQRLIELSIAPDHALSILEHLRDTGQIASLCAHHRAEAETV